MGERLVRWRWRDMLAIRFLAGILVFHWVCLGWLLFRARDMATVVALASGLLHGRWELPVLTGCILASALALAALVEVPQRIWGRDDYPEAFAPLIQGACLGMLVALTMVFGDTSSVPFIYFQF